jgi:hypothetical protein
MGMMATMAALVLGLLVASAKNFDGLMQISSAPLRSALAHLGQ